MQPKRARATAGGQRRRGPLSGLTRNLCPTPVGRSNDSASTSSSSCGAQATPCPDVEPVHVVCRLRPVPDSAPLCVERLDDSTLQLTPPPDSQAFRNGVAKQQCYRFHSIFANASQQAVFNGVARELVCDLLTGKDALLFAYGVTGSGKTHTMMGSSSESGIIPRSLDMVFANITSVQARRKVFRPDGQYSFQVRCEADALLERQREMLAAAAGMKTPAKRLGCATPGTSSKRAAMGAATPMPAVSDRGSGSECDTQMPAALRPDLVDEDSAYAVFISYVELYNNNVYDLLEEISADNMKRELRVCQLREDTVNNRVWVQGVNEVEVSNAAEAMEVLRRGQRRRKVAHTSLNSESSRSHSVFTIRLVQAPLDARGEEVLTDNNLINVGQLSLVDLAGSERANRTKNQGDTLREAGSINKSLMALRVYVEARRALQRASQAAASGINGATPARVPVVPNARSDKLTHLFKSHFDGHGRIKMIVCVNPRADEYDETINVMQFAELTQEVAVTRHEEKLNTAIGLTPGRRKANQLLREAQDRLGTAASASAPLNDAERNVIYCLGPEWPSIHMSADAQAETLAALERFLQRRQQQRVKLSTDLRQKQSVFRERLVAVEMNIAGLRSENSTLRQNAAAQQRRIDELQRLVADRDALNTSLSRRLNEATNSHQQLERRLDEQDHQMNQQQLDKQRTRQHLHNRLVRDRQRQVHETERLLSERQAMKHELRARNDKLRAMRQLLDTGSDVFVKPKPAPPPPPPPTSVTSRSDRPQQQQPPPPSPRVTRSGRTRAGSDTSLSATPQAKRIAPVASMRRRSKSFDAETWLDHRPGRVLQMATLFQPKMKKRKSVSNLEAKDLINNKTSKYVITHQEMDSAGEVETHMVKGDVVPTISGGRAVMFNDMESLRLSGPAVAATVVNGDAAVSSRLDCDTVASRCQTGIEGHSTTRSLRSHKG